MVTKQEQVASRTAQGSVRNTRLNAASVHRMRKVVDDLLASTSPCKVIWQLITQSNAPGVDPFARYAGFALRDAGGLELSRFSPAHPIVLVPPRNGHLARLWCAAGLAPSDQALLINVESAVNRLIGIADTVEDSADFGREGGLRRIGISSYGGGFLPNRPGYRSALVRLPEIGMNEKPTAAYFNEVDWRALDHIASNGRAVFQASMLPNMHQSVMGSFAPDGSDWDVRTRLAATLVGLEVPLRSECGFDVDTAARAVSIRFTVPPESAFPARATDPALGALAPIGKRINDARMAYAMRLTCLAAAACFGSGRHIERAYVAAERPEDGRVILSCTFNRHDYVHGVLCAIDSGAFADPALRFDPAGVARLMAPCLLEYSDLSDRGAAIEPPDDGMDAQRPAPHLDKRPLPRDMRNLFHASLVCDIDTHHYFGAGGPLVDKARSDSHESPIAAIAHLEGIVAEASADAIPPGDDADARPLFCSNPLSRAVVSLLDDDMDVGRQAEAFLHDAEHPAGKSMSAPEEGPRYFRAPHALFHAHMGLSDLYEQIGDVRGAEAEADRCIALAPTTAQAHFRKSDVLAQQGRFAEAANVILDALRFTVKERDCALLYYHLALILWNTGSKREAAAVHVYTASLEGEYAEKAQRVVANLRKRSDSPVIVHASPLAASREMTRARIPIAPSEAARALVVKAAIGLSCAGAPAACAPYAAALASYLHDDRIVVAACRSIISGTALK